VSREDEVHLLVAKLFVDILGFVALVGCQIDQRAVGGACGALDLNRWDRGRGRNGGF